MRNWEDVLPKNIAKAQHGWEKRKLILRAINAGAKRKEIAKKFGLSTERVRQMFFKAQREIKREEKSPIEKYFNQFPWDSSATHRYVYDTIKKNFNETTKSGRRNIRAAATNFMMERNQ